MKYNKNYCPWSTKRELSNENFALTKIQKLLNCNCQFNEDCPGYCTLPTNHTLIIPSGILWSNSNNNYYILPSSNLDRELFAETDIQVNDDLEIYFVNSLTFENDLISITQSDSSIETLPYTLSAVFQGFGNYIQDPEHPILHYLAKNNVDANGLLNGYKISPFTPFNTEHSIPAGTKFKGLKWNSSIINADTKELLDYIPSGYITVFRIKSWWSNTIKCTGKLKLTIKSRINEMPNNTFKDVLNITSNYDYVERNFGFFKYQQENLHKSNIYSIKLSNSGLNPENDEHPNYIYELDTFINILKNEVKVNSNGQLETDLSKTPLYELYYDSAKKRFYTNLTDGNLAGELALLLKVNIIFTFEEVAKKAGWYYEFDNKNKFKFAYKIDEINNIIKRNKIKNEMRNLLETAIRKSVVKYMPVETTLWKIIYSGK